MPGTESIFFKLETMGVPGTESIFFKSYLEGRSQLLELRYTVNSRAKIVRPSLQSPVD